MGQQVFLQSSLKRSDKCREIDEWFWKNDPKASDLIMSRLKKKYHFLEGRTRVCCNILGGLVIRGERLIKLADS